MENSEPVNDSTPDPGELLRSAREALGISRREMAARLNWVPGFVAAIEENRFEVLRGAAFVRGYLRAYAKLVQVPEDTLMAAYDALQPGEQSPEHKSKRVESRVPQVQKKGIAIPAGAALVVLVIFLLWYWRGDEQPGTGTLPSTAVERNAVDAPAQAEALVQEQSVAIPRAPASSRPEGRNTPADQATEAGAGPADTADPTPITSASEGSTGSDDDSSSSGSTESSESPESVAVATIAEADVSAAAEQTDTSAALPGDVFGDLAPAEPAAQGPLQFRFSGDCWLEVRDAAGELIYADLRRDGDVLNLSGEAPFSVLLGDAGVVELDYLDEPVLIKRRPGRVIASFSVGEE